MLLAMRLNKKVILCLLLCVFASLRGVFPSYAQVRPVNDYGALGLAQLLKRLNTTASVMMIGAHPDDEDSALIAYLARGESARTAYLSLTRGDGGQNIIGPELGEALGVLRTEELLQARRLDGAEQYFTRAYDYGFSKTLAEAKSKWPEEVIKCDVVRAIRLFRPLVVISRFTGTPADGHGQHQYAGYITPIAVKAAADPQQCTDAGTPWQVLKFYVEQSFSDSKEPTLKINTGQYDPILGRSYFEIAMEGRSMHRSQGEGRIEFHGDQFSGLNLVKSSLRKVGEANTEFEKETSLFDGIDTSIAGFAKRLDSDNSFMGGHLKKIQKPLRNAHKDYLLSNSRDLLKDLLSSYTTLAEGLQPVFVSGNARLISNALSLRWATFQTKQNELTDAISRLLALQIDALADKETVAPGESLFVAVKTFLPSGSALKIKSIELSAPPTWMAVNADEPKENNAAFVKRETASKASFFNVKVSPDAKPTQPYWLQSPREGDLYSWPTADYLTLPFEPQPLKAVVKAEIDGNEVTFEQPVQFRYADPARGETRRDVNVVPGLSVSVDQNLLMLPYSDKSQVRRVMVSVVNNSAQEQSGSVLLQLDTVPSWQVSAPLGSTFSLKSKGAKMTIPFEITVPPRQTASTIKIRAIAGLRDGLADRAMNVIAYPHIQTHRYYTPAETKVNIIDLKTIPAKIGYVMGSGDEIPESIRQMGMDVSLLDEKDLAAGDLAKFDTIVVGIRASETRPDMMSNKQRLMDYVNNGGNLIMQYQRGNFAQSGLPPYPVDTNDKQGTTAGSVARVVDENAPVKILDPAHPIFNFPNKITDEDFKGWVQERNAYNLVTFDPKYTPLLESHDAGEQENKGGLVIAKVGKGNWVYCSYSFFRQLPAGVPGAYRLFANLLSLPKAGK